MTMTVRVVAKAVVSGGQVSVGGVIASCWLLLIPRSEQGALRWVEKSQMIDTFLLTSNCSKNFINTIVTLSMFVSSIAYRIHIL